MNPYSEEYTKALTIEELLEKELYESFSNYDNYVVMSEDKDSAKEYSYTVDKSKSEMVKRPRIYPIISLKNGDPILYRDAITNENYVKDSKGQLQLYGEKTNKLDIEKINLETKINFDSLQDTKINLLLQNQYQNIIYDEISDYPIKKEIDESPNTSSKDKFKFNRLINKLKNLLIKIGFNEKTIKLIIKDIGNNIEKVEYIITNIDKEKIILDSKYKIVDTKDAVVDKIDYVIDELPNSLDSDKVTLFNKSIDKKKLKIIVYVIIALFIFFIIKSIL